MVTVREQISDALNSGHELSIKTIKSMCRADAVQSVEPALTAMVDAGLVIQLSKNRFKKVG